MAVCTYDMECFIFVTHGMILKLYLVTFDNVDFLFSQGSAATY